MTSALFGRRIVSLSWRYANSARSDYLFCAMHAAAALRATRANSRFRRRADDRKKRQSCFRKALLIRVAAADCNRSIVLKNSSGARLSTFAGVLRPFPELGSSILGRSKRSFFAAGKRLTLRQSLSNTIGRSVSLS